MDFPFHQTYELDDYNDNYKPTVFFGMYRYEDIVLLFAHHSSIIILWTGQDALQFKHWGSIADTRQITNVTAHPKVHQLITSNGCNCKLIKPAAFLNTVNPQKLGKKIYAYCPASAPEYHGAEIIHKLRKAGYDIIVGDGTHAQENWRGMLADSYYNQAFIGLCLSEFAGGGGSIIEMGLRGMRVVTNVFDLPNCIPWASVEDIMTAIELETKLIGETNTDLAIEVWNDLDHAHKWLEI